MKIGELAAKSGVSIDAVRYYERRGVLARADRTTSGYRIFNETDVDRLRIVRQLQDLSFTLDEIVDALQAHDRGGVTCESERWRLEAVTTRIDDRIKQLQRTRRTINKSLAACEQGSCALTST